jgi:hypothetical protein
MAPKPHEFRSRADSGSRSPLVVPGMRIGCSCAALRLPSRHHWTSPQNSPRVLSRRTTSRPGLSRSNRRGRLLRLGEGSMKRKLGGPLDRSQIELARA